MLHTPGLARHGLSVQGGTDLGMAHRTGCWQQQTFFRLSPHHVNEDQKLPYIKNGSRTARKYEN